MFKPGRWRSEKSTVKFVFKLRFHAAKVPSVGDDGLTVSVVPDDTGKASGVSDKAFVHEGSCLWDNSVYEAVKFKLDPKSGKFHERIYHFVVATVGSSKPIGEASIDFAKYTGASKVTLVSVPLKNSKTEAVLNVSIQRMKESDDHRVAAGSEDEKPKYKDSSLMSRMCHEDTNVAVVDDSLSKRVISGCRESSGSDLTMSSSGSSSGVEIQSNGLDPGSTRIAVREERNRLDWEWLGNSALEDSSRCDSLSTPRVNFKRLKLDEGHDVEVEKLKSEIALLSRQVEKSEIEIQTLRKQVVKESKRGQGLYQEIVSLKEERDALRLECEKLRVLGHDGDEYKAFIEQLLQELHHEKELNSKLQHMRKMYSEMVHEDDDKEQKALEELLNQNGDAKDVYLLEQQMLQMQNELEMYKRDKDELEMQMEQLALDYEVMKQENHEMACNLQHIQLREELKTQCDYSSCRELEAQMENLEEKLKSHSNETQMAVMRITELEVHINDMEDQISKQAMGFEVDLEHLFQIQEKSVKLDEEALIEEQLQNASMVDLLQEKVTRLSMQMASTFEANKKLAVEALTEANELRAQRACLDERIKMAIKENQSIRDLYEIQLEQLVRQVKSSEDDNGNMPSKFENKYLQLQHQQADAEGTKRLLPYEILMLRMTEAKATSPTEEKTKQNFKNDGIFEPQQLQMSADDDEQEEDKLIKQVDQLSNLMKDKEDKLIKIVKMKSSTCQGTASPSKSGHPTSFASKDIPNLQDEKEMHIVGQKQELEEQSQLLGRKNSIETMQLKRPVPQ